MIKTKNKYRAYAYFATGTLFYVAFGFELLSGTIPRGSSDPAKFYNENPGFFWTYIVIMFLLFFYQFARGVHLYLTRLRRDTDPVAEKGSFSPRIANIITSCIVIPIGLCFLILPAVELFKRTAYGGAVFGNHPMANDPGVFWGLVIFQMLIGFFPIICGILLFMFPPMHLDQIAEIEQLPVQVNSRPPMKTSTKVIIGAVLGVFLLGCVAIAAIAVGAAYVYKKIDDPILAAKQKKAAEEGAEFGKTTDQAGCIEKGLTIESPKDVFDLSNKSFIHACLKSSRKTPSFCDGVPLILNSKWITDQCQQLGHDTSGCDAAYIEKLDYCRSDQDKPKT